MEISTYKTMTLEHLGDNANVADLAAFRRACNLRHHVVDETELETTDWMWGDGDWLSRVGQYVRTARSAAIGDILQMSDAESQDFADEIERGEHDA
jgi:hypothetical protein